MTAPIVSTSASSEQNVNVLYQDNQEESVELFESTTISLLMYSDSDGDHYFDVAVMLPITDLGKSSRPGGGYNYKYKDTNGVEYSGADY